MLNENMSVTLPNMTLSIRLEKPPPMIMIKAYFASLFVYLLFRMKIRAAAIMAAGTPIRKALLSANMPKAAPGFLT